MNTYQVKVVHRDSIIVYVEAEDAVDAEAQAIRSWFSLSSDDSQTRGVRRPKEHRREDMGPWEILSIVSKEVTGAEVPED